MTCRRQPEYPVELECVREHEASHPPSAWARKAQAVLVPTPGYPKSYIEIKAELEAGGVPVPPGIAMMADRERCLGWKPERDS